MVNEKSSSAMITDAGAHVAAPRPNTPQIGLRAFAITPA